MILEMLGAHFYMVRFMSRLPQCHEQALALKAAALQYTLSQQLSPDLASALRSPL